jgi:WD40 repeat protein
MQPSGVEVQQLGAVAICGSGGHGACTRVCLSKQGCVVSGTADGTLQVRPRAVLHTPRVSHTLLATLSVPVRWWARWARGEERKETTLSVTFGGGARTPRERTAVHSASHTLKHGPPDTHTQQVWRVQDGTAVLTVPSLHPGGLSSLTLLQLPDATVCCLSGGVDGAVRVTSLGDGTSRGDAPEAHAGTVTSAAASREGGRAYTTGVDGTVRMWIIASVAGGGAGGGPSGWGSSLRLGATALPGDGPITCAELARDSTLLFTGTASGVVRTWRGADLSGMHTLWGHTGPLRAVSLSHDHDVAISAAGDGTLRVWRLAAGATGGGGNEAAQVLTCVPGNGGDTADEPTVVQLSADGSVAYVGYGSGAVRAWRTADGVVLKTCVPPPHNPAALHAALAAAPVTALALSHAEDRMVVSSGDGSTRLLRCSDLAVTHTLFGHRDAVTCAAVSKDGHYVCAAGMEGIVRAWRVGAPPQLVTFTRAACLTIDTRTPGCIPQNLSKAVATAVAKASKELAPGSQARQQAAAAMRHAVGAAQASAHAIASALRERGVAVPAGVGKPQGAGAASMAFPSPPRFAEEAVVSAPAVPHADVAPGVQSEAGGHPDVMPMFPVPRAYDVTSME